MGDAARALRTGRISENEFIRVTKFRWERLARDLYARWRSKLPAWVEVYDVEVEVMVHAIKFVGKWDPDRPTCGEIGAYVMWMTRKRTQRFMHKEWRKAKIHGNEGKNPSRSDIAVSLLKPRFNKEGKQEEFDLFDKKTPESAGQETAAIAREIYDAALAHATTTRDALVFYALREAAGSPAQAVKAILSDPRARIECEFDNEEHALRVTSRRAREAWNLFGSAA